MASCVLGRAAAVCALLLGLAACADRPVQLAAQYAPPNLAPPSATPSTAKAATCRVELAGVEDLRGDRESAGVFGFRAVHAEDAGAWLRSGLLAPPRDPRLAMSDQASGAAADLVIRVELLKLYLLPINEAQSANVVVRVRYAGAGGGADERVYRGVETTLQWTGFDSEARAVFDSALSRLLADLDRDLLRRCAAKAR